MHTRQLTSWSFPEASPQPRSSSPCSSCSRPPWTEAPWSCGRPSLSSCVSQRPEPGSWLAKTGSKYLKKQQRRRCRKLLLTSLTQLSSCTSAQLFKASAVLTPRKTCWHFSPHTAVFKPKLLAKRGLSGLSPVSPIRLCSFIFVSYGPFFYVHDDGVQSNVCYGPIAVQLSLDSANVFHQQLPYW